MDEDFESRLTKADPACIYAVCKKYGTCIYPASGGGKCSLIFRAHVLKASATDVDHLRAQLAVVRMALDTLIDSIERKFGDGTEEALDGDLDADMTHDELKRIRALLEPSGGENV